ncbi:uncharacterized protein G2W53_033335 [Senna tora]|uniref:Uncharacterized protein n=1 Tax=Senna tora TaxID=362788 RepID=A0A834WCQ7_9FABA|nr:uncharacterized protein G2W53_033335 [Senna tora]
MVFCFFVKNFLLFLLPFRISDIVSAKMTRPDFNIGNWTNERQYRCHWVDKEVAKQVNESREEASQAHEVTRTMLELTKGVWVVARMVLPARGLRGSGMSWRFSWVRYCSYWVLSLTWTSVGKRFILIRPAVTTLTWRD